MQDFDAFRQIFDAHGSLAVARRRPGCVRRAIYAAVSAITNVKRSGVRLSRAAV